MRLLQATTLAILCLFTQVAFAQTIEIDQTEQLSFGALEKPASGSDTFTISPSGATSGTGTLLYGSTSRGAYRIKNTGTPPAITTITIDIANISSNASGLTLSDFKGRYNNSDLSSFPAVGLTAPAAGSDITLYLGATATYTSAVAAGSPTPSFDIVVNYE